MPKNAKSQKNSRNSGDFSGVKSEAGKKIAASDSVSANLSRATNVRSKKTSSECEKKEPLEKGRNFRVRAICSVVMSILVFASLGLLDGVPFRVLYVCAAVVAFLELMSFFSKKCAAKSLVLSFIETALLILAGFFVFNHEAIVILATVVCIASYDIFAYLFGCVFGGKFFPNSRPFPHISKNKTWEGTLLGLISSLLIAIGLIEISAGALPCWLMACGILALCGDLLESALKRSFPVKDSNEIVIKYPFFKVVELLVGGNEGHGGYLDRIDSFIFTASVLFLISLVV